MIPSPYKVYIVHLYSNSEEKKNDKNYLKRQDSYSAITGTDCPEYPYKMLKAHVKLYIIY